MAAHVRQWPWAVVAFLLTAALLMAGRSVYVRSARQAPFLREAAAVPGVERVRLAGPDQVQVWLRTDAAPDAAYTAVAALAHAKLGPSAAIHLVDNPTPAEARLGRDLSLMVAEAEARGNYVTMAQQASALAARHRDTLTWTLGPQNVFLTLNHGTHRLILVFPLNWVRPVGGA